MPDNTSTLIIDYLRKNRSATATELSLALSMTKSNIRHHLKTLLHAMEIEAFPTSSQNPNRRGRPEFHYRISMAREDNNILNLSSALLDLLNKLTRATEGSSKYFESLVELLFPNIHPTSQTVRNLNQAILLLNQHHYQARWEAYKSGPRLTFRNCPYAQLLEAHPELCMIDTVLLSYLAGVPVAMESRIDFNKPGSMCIFIAGNQM